MGGGDDVKRDLVLQNLFKVVGQRSRPPLDGRGNKDTPKILGKESVPSQPFPHTQGTFSFSSQLSGFPGGSSIGLEAERKEQPSPAPGLRTRGSQLVLGPAGAAEGNRAPGIPPARHQVAHAGTARRLPQPITATARPAHAQPETAE